MLALRQSTKQIVGRRWGTASRFLSSGGKVLSDEEKARENVYIKQMEKERAEKLAHKGEGSHDEGKTSAEAAPAADRMPPPSTDSNTTLAVGAGVVAVGIGAYFWFSSPGKKEEK